MAEFSLKPFLFSPVSFFWPHVDSLPAQNSGLQLVAAFPAAAPLGGRGGVSLLGI